MRRCDPEDEEELDEKSGIDGRDLKGGTKMVDREPLLDTLLVLSIERMVRMEPATDGERVMEEESGIATGRLIISLYYDV